MDKENEIQKDIFMQGIEKYKRTGVFVSIDDQEFQREDYEKLTGIREDGSFYMGDYIRDEEGKLREIHFDRVYHR